MPATSPYRLALAAALVAAVLQACGGGDEQQEPGPAPSESKPTPHVPCDVKPELCQ